jgi:hypothetical protein
VTAPLPESPVPKLEPPVIVNEGHRIIRTNYFDDGFPMRLAGLPWLDCHLGFLRLLYVGHPVPEHCWSFSDFAILTRGDGPEFVEMLELFFPSQQEQRNPLPVYLHRWQCNRFPSWKPGKRCWELVVYGGPGFAETAPRTVITRRVFFREGRIPCREWWTGPRQDGKPQPVPPKLTDDEWQDQLRALKEPGQPCEGYTKPKAKGRFISEKETARQVKKWQDQQERKRLG